MAREEKRVDWSAVVLKVDGVGEVELQHCCDMSCCGGGLCKRLIPARLM